MSLDFTTDTWNIRCDISMKHRLHSKTKAGN